MIGRAVVSAGAGDLSSAAEALDPDLNDLLSPPCGLVSGDPGFVRPSVRGSSSGLLSERSSDSADVIKYI